MILSTSKQIPATFSYKNTMCTVLVHIRCVVYSISLVVDNLPSDDNKDVYMSSFLTSTWTGKLQLYCIHNKWCSVVFGIMHTQLPVDTVCSKYRPLYMSVCVVLLLCCCCAVCTCCCCCCCCCCTCVAST